MPVYIKKRIKDGWKAKEREREGRCLVWIFCDAKTDKELFVYAPNLSDEKFFVEGFKELKVYDELHKAILNFETSINTSQTTKGQNPRCKG